MTPIDKLPDLDWTELAKQEIILTGENLVQTSDVAFQIGRVAIKGRPAFNSLFPRVG